MCGIAGIWQFSGLADVVPTAGRIEGALQTMTRALAHRGPDGNDTLLWADHGLGLAHTRLALVDLSPTGAQPMVSQSGRYAITFNGEIYNHREIRGRIDRTLKGTSDVEVFIERLADVGLRAALEETVGMFAFALYDRAERELTLARDRMGEKPLYYWQTESEVWFASELKPLLRAGDAFRINPDAVDEYLRYGYLRSPSCILADVAKLEPGTWRTIRANGRWTQDVYWNLAARAAQLAGQPRITRLEEGVELLETQLEETLTLQAQADVPVGAYLSGGVDSSTLVALMARHAPGKLKTFTAGFEDPRFNEANEARAIANHLGTEHIEMVVRPEDTLRLVDELPEIYDEPFADPSAIPSTYIARLTRQHLKAVVSADAGDELFAGYNTYGWMQSIWRRAESIPPPFRSAITALSPSDDRLGAARWFGTVDKAMRLANRMDARDGHQFFDRLSYHWSHGLRTGERAVRSHELTVQQVARGLRGTEAYQLRDALSYLPGDILVKVDRASMSTSLESRAPFLDHRIVELAWRLDPALKNGSGTTKRVLRALRAKHLPSHFGVSKKMGFGVPIAAWLREDLRDWAEDLLQKQHVESLGLMWKPVARTWRTHLRGVDRKNPLWTLLMLLAWQRHWKAHLQA